MLSSLNSHYVRPIRTFDRNTRYFLWMTVINGIIFSGWQLFFNIFMLERGFGRDFLGLLNSLPSLSGLLFGIAVGRLSDRIGRKPALVIGIVCTSLALFGQISFQQTTWIVVMSILVGIFNMLIIVSISPLMMKLSTVENRTLLFSLSHGLQTLSGAVGAVFAGQLPGLFGRLLNVEAASALAYQAVLTTTIVIGTTALIPLWLMREPKTSPPPEPRPTQPGPVRAGSGSPSRMTRLTIKLALPNLLIGFGAAILIPYMNVFFKDRFAISDSLLGILFSLSSLFIGIGSLIGPRLATRLGGKIRTVAFTQLSSILFMLMIGFVPSLWVAGAAFLIRAALMNMSAPLYSAFCMEQTPENEQGLVSSVLNIAWNAGWAVGPYISGLVQGACGFTPLFIATTLLYLTAIGVMWTFFRKTEMQLQPAAAD
jgi:MFS family permease